MMKTPPQSSEPNKNHDSIKQECLVFGKLDPGNFVNAANAKSVGL